MILSAAKFRNTFFLFLAFSLLFFTFSSAEVEFDEEEDEFFQDEQHIDNDFLFRHEGIDVPLRIHIGLLGFNEKEINPSELSKLLTDTLHNYKPSYLDKKESLSNLNYVLNYDIQHLPKDNFRKLESLLSKNLQPVDKKSHLSDYLDYTIDISSEVSNFFKNLDALPPSFSNEYTIYFINPDLSRSGRVRYAYKKSGDNQPPTQCWVSTERYLVVDLSAYVVPFGGVQGEGALDPNMFSFINPSSKSFLTSKLLNYIISAVEFLFVSDISNEQLLLFQSEQVFVPVITLHSNFSGFDRRMDKDLIKSEAKRMALPNQDLEILFTEHELKDHKQIALALEKALQEDPCPIHRPTQYGTFKSSFIEHPEETRSFVNGPALAFEMKHAVDGLASTLLRRDSAKFRSFFTHTSPGLKHMASKDPAAPTVMMGMRDRDGLRKLNAKPGDLSQAAQLNRPYTGLQGIRVLPVFVFDISHFDEPITFEDYSYVHATNDMVLVLQTVRTPSKPMYFVGKRTDMGYTGNQTTAHVLSGLLQSLGGLVPPTVRYSRTRHDLHKSYRWTVGAHPFGPFTDDYEIGARPAPISKIFMDAITRNLVISRVDSAIQTIIKSLERVEKFAGEWLDDPSMASFFESKTKSWKSGWIEELFHSDPSKNNDLKREKDRHRLKIEDQLTGESPLPQNTVKHLHEQIKRLERLLLDVADLLNSYELAEAYKASSSFGVVVKRFKQYVHDEIETAEKNMECCKRLHGTTLAAPSVARLLLTVSAYSFMILIILGLITYFFATPIRRSLYRILR